MIIRQELQEKMRNLKTQGSMCFLQENHEPQGRLYLDINYEKHNNLLKSRSTLLL